MLFVVLSKSIDSWQVNKSGWIERTIYATLKSARRYFAMLAMSVDNLLCVRNAGKRNARTAPASQLVAEDFAMIAEKQPGVDLADRAGATSTAMSMMLLNYMVILIGSTAGVRGQPAKSAEMEVSTSNKILEALVSVHFRISFLNVTQSPVHKSPAVISCL